MGASETSISSGIVSPLGTRLTPLSGANGTTSLIATSAQSAQKSFRGAFLNKNLIQATARTSHEADMLIFMSFISRLLIGVVSVIVQKLFYGLQVIFAQLFSARKRRYESGQRTFKFFLNEGVYFGGLDFFS